MPTSEPDWLSAEDLELLNRLIVADTGEPHGVLKAHELASAPARPRQLWHYEGVEDLATLAVRLMLGVAWAHPFEQGNKRTGFIAAVIFLEANGWLLDIPDFEDIAELFIAAVAEPELEAELVELFRRNMIETI